QTSPRSCQPRSAIVMPPSNANAFCEPKRWLDPPTKRTPETSGSVRHIDRSSCTHVLAVIAHILLRAETGAARLQAEQPEQLPLPTHDGKTPATGPVENPQSFSQRRVRSDDSPGQRSNRRTGCMRGPFVLQVRSLHSRNETSTVDEKRHVQVRVE